MDIQQMRYVLAIARAGSIRAAATALFIAPQTLSEQLHRLERTIGTMLFTRSSAGMALTETGEVFVAHATDAVAAFDQATSAIQQAASGRPAELRVAWAYGLADVLQDLLRQMVTDSPQQHVRAVAMGCAEQRNALASGEITAGLSHHPPQIRAPKGMRHIVVDSAAPHALLPATHRLATRSQVTLTDLAREPLVLPSEAGPSCLRDWELSEFHRNGLTPRIAAEVSNTDLAVAYVAAGTGYALCVRTSHPVGDGVVFVPVAGDLTPQQVALIWTAETDPSIIHAARRLARRPAATSTVGKATAGMA